MCKTSTLGFFPLLTAPSTKKLTRSRCSPPPRSLAQFTTRSGPSDLFPCSPSTRLTSQTPNPPSNFQEGTSQKGRQPFPKDQSISIRSSFPLVVF
jgi:hypothetical protein